MDKNTVVIAIDHGWSNMKTVHETFTSGIREITTEPALFENVLEKDGKYYKVGSERLKVKDSKVEDENYYLLSLAATAKELDRLGKRTANVYWAVGLPLTRFGKEKEAFIKYLNQNREVTFKYEKKQYHIITTGVHDGSCAGRDRRGYLGGRRRGYFAQRSGRRTFARPI